MNILNACTLKSLRLNRRRTAVTIIGVILSTALLCGTAILAASFRDMAIRGAIASSGNYHVLFENVPADKAQYLKNNSAVKTGMISRTLGYSLLPHSKNPYKPYICVTAYDADKLLNQPIKLITGRLPKTPGEIVLAQDIQSDGSAAFKVGDTICLKTGARSQDGVTELESGYRVSNGEKLINVVTRSYRVTGFIQKPDFEPARTPGYTAITYLDSSSLSSVDKVNVAALMKKPAAIYTQAPDMLKSAGLAAPAQDEADPNALQINYNDSLLMWLGVRANSNYSIAYLITILIIILIVIIGSVTVIYNSFSISVSERKKQFGMLASVGATARQIRRSVLFEALIVGAVGIVIGILCGIIGITATLSVASGILKQLVNIGTPLRLVIPAWVLITTVLLAAFTILLSAFLPALRAARITPIDAIRQNSEFTFKNRRNLKTPRFVRALFGFEGELALKTLRRNRRKYRATVISLFISIVMFLSFTSFMYYSSVENDKHAPPAHDFTATLQNADRINYQPFIRQAVSLPQVKEYTVEQGISGIYKTDKNGLNASLRKNPDLLDRLGLSSGSEYNIQVSIYSLNDAAFERLAKSAHQNPADYQNPDIPRGIAVNHNDLVMTNQKTQQNEEFSFDLLNIHPGSTIPVLDMKDSGGTGANSTDITVGAIVQSLDGEKAYSMGETIYISEAVFNRIKTSFGKSSIEDTITLAIKSSDNPKLTAELKTLYTQLIGGQMEYFSVSENMKKVMLVVTLMSLFCYGFILIITLIGITNIVNTINTNFRLRRREFAVLKSVGMTPKGFGRMLRCESLFYGLKALLYGLPAGIAIDYLFFCEISMGTGDKLAFTIPWIPYLCCIAGVFLIVFVTMLYAGAKAKNDNIIDAIREENL